MQVRMQRVGDPAPISREEKFLAGKRLSEQTISTLDIKNRDQAAIHQNFVQAFDMMRTGRGVNQWSDDDLLIFMRNLRHLLQNLVASSHALKIDWSLVSYWEFRAWDFYQLQSDNTKVDYRYYMELALACVQYPGAYATMAHERELTNVELENSLYYVEQTQTVLNKLDELLPTQKYMYDVDYRCCHAEIYRQLARAYGSLRDVDKSLCMASSAAHYFALNGGQPDFSSIAAVYADLALIFAGNVTDKPIFEFARDFFGGRLTASYADLQNMVNAYNNVSDSESHRSDMMMQMMRLMEMYIDSPVANADVLIKWQREFSLPFTELLKKKQEAYERAQITASLSDFATLQVEVQAVVDRAHAILADVRDVRAANNGNNVRLARQNLGFFAQVDDDQEDEFIIMQEKTQQLNQ